MSSLLSSKTQEASDSILEIADLSVDFSTPAGFLRRTHISAVDHISIKIKKGESLGFVGESGSGKTTVARTILKLTKPSSGHVYFNGQDIFKQDKKHSKEYRKHVQMIFQDPYESLNPRSNVLQAVEEPLIVHRIAENKDERRKKAYELLSLVGLENDLAKRFSHELSGGQRQRVSIARALAVNPDVLIADEPVSMLDVSIRVGILNLLKDLKKVFNLTFVFITHDLGVARYFCDRIAVIYRGQIMEMSNTEALINSTRNPYTELLLESVPKGKQQVSEKILTKTKLNDDDVGVSGQKNAGAQTFLYSSPTGCRFNPRCPNAKEDCSKTPPPLLESDKQHFVACYHPLTTV